MIPYFDKRWKMSSTLIYDGYDHEILKEFSNQIVFKVPKLKSQYHKFNKAKPNLKELQLLMFNFLKEKYIIIVPYKI
jgi:hypothetical protein